MKLLVSVLLIILLSPLSNAFSQGITNDFLISDIVKLDSADSISLFRKGTKWFKTVGFKNIDSTQGKLSGTSDFNVYQRGIVSNQIHGKVSYSADLEVKNNKYRYTFKNFVYHYHKQDRYRNMIPTGKTKALSEAKAEGWQKTWDAHKTYTKKQINILIANLKESMTETKAVTFKKQEEDF